MAGTGAHSSGQGGKNPGHTPGAVKDPEHDRRLKENRDAASSVKDKDMGEKRMSGSGHTTGAVKDPEHDRRLKENRESGGSMKDKGMGEKAMSQKDMSQKDMAEKHASDKGHTPGAVKDPEHDRRLKENRDK